MRLTFTLLSLFFLYHLQGQSIYTTLHLNEERDVHNGVPRKIIRHSFTYQHGRKEKKKEVTEYDEAGLPAASWFYNEKGKVAAIYRFRYDRTRRLLLETRIPLQEVQYPTAKVRTEYIYDRSASPVMICYYDSTGAVLAEVMLRNNQLGLPEELRLYEPVGYMMGIEKAVYLPDENKAVVTVVNKDGRTISKDTMKISFRDAHRFSDPCLRYNEKGDIVYAASTWPDGSRHEKQFVYRYDAMGNWTEQKVYDILLPSNGRKKKILTNYFKREITYWGSRGLAGNR